MFHINIMKKILTLTILVAISLLNLNMRTLNDTSDANVKYKSYEKCVPVNNYSFCTHNSVLKEGGWNGTLNLELTTQVDCTYRDGTIHETESRQQNINLNLSADNIDFGKGMVAKISNLKNNGGVDVKYTFKQEEKRKEYFRLKTMDSDDSFPVNDDCLVGMIIQKKMGNNPQAIQEKLQDLMQKADYNKIMEEVESINKQDKGEGLEIEVVIQTVAPWLVNTTITEVIRSSHEKKDNTYSEDIMLAVPLQVHLKGSMSTGKDGSGTLVASFTGKEDTPNGKPSSFGCPPVISIKKCTLTLTR